MDPDAVRQCERVPHGSSDDPDLLDFSANTNPVVPDGARKAYGGAFDAARTYPNDRYPDFRAAAAEYVGCSADEVIPTPGGLAAIRLAIETHVEAGESVLVPYPSFGEYAREAELQGADPVFVASDEILSADPTDHALVVVCNPNNPTGDLYDPADLRAFAARCRAADTPLLVDEAFLGFTEDASLAGTEGTIVARSLTKLFGLPGLRAGFAVATGESQNAMATARRAWNLGTPAARVGAVCMRDKEFAAVTRARVAEERERMRETLAERYDVHSSDAPFLLLDVGDRDVAKLCEATERRGIAIRDATEFRGLTSHVRVAVRLPEENDRLLAVLEDV